MKILTILKDDQSMVVKKQIEALKGRKFEIHEFKPKSHEQEEAIEELAKLCRKESFDIALLDHYLFWDKLIGPVFTDTLKKLKIPFVLSNLP